MSALSSSMIDRFLCYWGTQVLRFPWLLISLVFLLTGSSLYYTAQNLGVNTNTAEMLSPDLPFQKNRQRIEAEFPQDANVIILVVNALTPEQTSLAANTLADTLKQLSNSFSSVYIPTENDFFRQQALLFLDQNELEDLSVKLIDAQPFIGYLSQNYHLEGLFNIISKALKETDDSLPMDLEPLLLAVNNTLAHQLSGKPYAVSWQNLLAANKLNSKSNRTIVIARPKMNFDAILPAEHALTATRNTVKLVIQENPGVRIRITGETALEHEELESVSEGAAIAGIISLLLVCISLWVGLRSFKLLFATFITLILGLILTAGFATVAIGHLNLISIAFAVLYIGLGVDYAIHICLHYRECRSLGKENGAAIIDSIHTVGFSIFLCAITTSLGFLAFIPTDYSGVSELGIISAGGMFIGLVVSLTVLPAFLTVLRIKDVKPIKPTFKLIFLTTLPFRQSKCIKIYSLVFAVYSCLLLTQLVFDSNPINLRDPNSESVATIKELLRSQTDSPFALSALANDWESAKKLAHQLEQLPSVHNTIFLNDLLAKNQDDKLEIIEELDLILGNQLDKFDDKFIATNPRQALLKLHADITEILEINTSHSNKATLERLQNNIRLFTNYYSEYNTAPYHTLEQNTLGLLPYTMNRLRTSLSALPYQLGDIPDYIKTHWLSPNGLYKVLIMPEHDQNKVENLKQFVAEVLSIAPSASGLPVADQASGVAVVNAFIQAFTGAVIAIFLLLLLILRDIKSATLVIGPLLLAALLTGATNVLLNNSFNFANIIALPLLMGMGVDSGIHIMHRLKSGLSCNKEILQSSTARGVFFSSLTTMCSFSSLAFTPHVGTASMGLLLAVGIFFTLVCTLIVLPAFYGNNNQ
ncbi:MAG: MMPL family transporter [Methylococcales symbiont of Hymedesmia sp. n. MRB-2018]|nr:MAG: MMPL family transporter [Methylococcales symbiont of Hymedesmia sp. n. MRB-2018]